MRRTASLLQYVHKIFEPQIAIVIIGSLCGLALMMAYIAEYGFGLAPCILCLYQRIPFAIGIVLCIAGLMIRPLQSNRLGIGLWSILSINFAANSALAFYHSGVERHWWVSVFEACSANLSGLSGDALIQAIRNTPAVRCDQIPWADPLLNLSMANWNVVFCLGLAIYAFVTLIKIMQHPANLKQPSHTQ
jgi:disulfide bond formation protein DsbB